MMPTTDDETARWLGTTLLEGVEDQARRAIFRRLEQARVVAGTPLLSQGVPNDRLWFVTEGSVAIERARADGRVDVLATLSGPGIFGTTTFFRSSVPSASIRASSTLAVWTLDRDGHESLRRDDPRSAEALALAIIRVLSDRFDLLDARISGLLADHGQDHPKANEWGDFRARLFEDA